MFIELVLRNWKLIVAALLLATIAGMGMYIKFLNSNISTLNAEKQVIQAKLDVSQSSVKSLQIAINDQNDAIDNMQIQADARERSHAGAIATAKATTISAKKKADELMAAMAPQNISKCDAANQLINQEIQRAK
jgi:predicted  nucleic acid-binding Zn-ribbon protein